MVTEWLFQTVVGLVTWVLDVIPFPALPSWVDTAASGLGTFTSVMAVVNDWIPVALVGLVILAYVGIHAFAVLVRLARQLLSYLTLGGGAV